MNVTDVLDINAEEISYYEEDGFLRYSFSINEFLNNGFYTFAKNVLKVYNRIFFGLKVIGLQNLQNIESGAVTVCNHVNILDCTMVACQVNDRPIFFPTLDSNTKMPFIGFLVKKLGGFPIPRKEADCAAFRRKVGTLLNKGSFVHFFPEGHLVPYDTGLRDFKRGAFTFAYDSGVPIIPIIITYREKDGLRRFFRRKPSLNLEILPPVYPDLNNPRREEISYLLERCKTAMEARQ